MIFNLTKSAQCINSIKKQIEERLKRKITQVYVGYSGQGIHSIFNNVGRPLGGESRISKEIVDELEAENLKSDVGNHSILDIVPQSYVVGKETSSDPIGVIADSIEVKYMNIIARHALKSNIENCFKEASLHVAGCILTPVSEAKMLMTDSEKRSGCVLVDFGADTTSVVVYKENKLRYIAVIPLGSANVTKDIESCQLDEQEAESLKLKYGSATNEIATIEEGKELIYNFPDGSGITKQKFSEIVEARMKEILINVAQQIKESGFDKGTLIGGAIFTGGASAMKNLIPAFKKATGISQVRVVRNIPNVLFTKTSGPKETDGRFIAAFCLRHHWNGKKCQHQGQCHEY
jgi:cell division protein FtsA